jgi:hypothetical protein
MFSSARRHSSRIEQPRSDQHLMAPYFQMFILFTKDFALFAISIYRNNLVGASGEH